jgi:hypothetical protein
MTSPNTHTDPAMFTMRDLERHMVRSKRLAVACRLAQDTAQADLHTVWMDILLDEWSRRMSRGWLAA